MKKLRTFFLSLLFLSINIAQAKFELVSTCLAACCPCLVHSKQKARNLKKIIDNDYVIKRYIRVRVSVMDNKKRSCFEKFRRCLGCK